MDITKFFTLTPGNEEKERESLNLLLEESEAAYQKDLPFLQDRAVAENYKLINYRKQDLTDQLLACAARIRASEELSHLAWHFYYRTFLNPNGGNWIPNLLVKEPYLTPREAGLFNLILAVSACPIIIQRYERLNIPREYGVNHCNWIVGTIDIFETAHGFPGHSIQQLAWLRWGITGNLYRVGRFEFDLMQSLPHWVPLLFRNKKTGKVAALAKPEWFFDAEWKHRTKDNGPNPVQYSEDANAYCGIRLRYDDTVEGLAVLPKSEWEPYPVRNVLGMHIPGGAGPMTPEITKASLMQAAEFFPKYLHKEIDLIICCSWILFPEWQKRMPKSNMANFQKSVFLYDHEVANGKAGLFFLFGRDNGNPLEYVCTNTAQKAMIQTLKDGIPLESGDMFIPVSSLSDYGHPEKF